MLTGEVRIYAQPTHAQPEPSDDRGHLEAFIRHRYRVSDFPVHKADRTFIEDFESYFAHEKAFKLNTTAGYLTVLASLLKDLYKRHVIDAYPFMDYSVR